MDDNPYNFTLAKSGPLIEQPIFVVKSDELSQFYALTHNYDPSDTAGT